MRSPAPPADPAAVHPWVVAGRAVPARGRVRAPAGFLRESDRLSAARAPVHLVDGSSWGRHVPAAARGAATWGAAALGVHALAHGPCAGPLGRGARYNPGAMTRDIYTEPEDIDLDTLANLGPLAGLAGTWEGQGTDTHPVAEGGEDEPYRERMVFEPIDPQPNGPQLLYGLRYHLHVNKLDEPLTFHDQVGYWLWEPATRTVYQSLAIPRAQVAMAMGAAAPSARRFTV